MQELLYVIYSLSKYMRELLYVIYSLK